MSITEIIELTDEELDEYIDVALSNADRVSPGARKKLKGILDKYRKMKHPFTACVRDNRKRFGKDAEKVCAVLKDLIKGTTKWRGKANMSEEELADFVLDIDESTAAYLSESLTEDSVELAVGDVVWNPSGSYDALRRKVGEAFQDDYAAEQGYSEYWVEDINGKEALVCYKGYDYFVVPFSVKRGEVVLSDEESWKPVEKAWVETNLAQDPQTLAELFFTDGEGTFEDELYWKPVLREGTWKFSPGPGQVPINKPITVVKEGKSDSGKLVISIEEIAKNFESGVVEHVTVPTSHADKVLENTGFVKGVRIGTDEKGRATLEAGIEFTEPDVKEKAQRGTIANTSAGILFDYIQKESGHKYNAVMAHTALTNHPWLNGMKPFGVEASENLQVVAFSEENNDNPGESPEEVTNVTTTETAAPEVEAPANTFLSELGLSEDEVKARLQRYEELERESRENEIDTKIKKWEEEGKSPAVLSVARPILMADDGAVALNLSEDGRAQSLTASQIVDRIVSAIPAVNLAEAPVTGERHATEAPPVGTEEENGPQLTLSEKTEAFNLIVNEKLSEEDAIKRVVSKRENS